MELTKGTKINLENGRGSIQIISKLGEGGQGYVYKVADSRGKEYALKWYKKSAISDMQTFRKNLIRNIEEGTPASGFLWPVAITEYVDGTFGYIMDLRPVNYKEFTEFLIGKTEFASVDKMINAAIKIVDSFRMLHNKGFSYQDLNDGNFFIDPSTGDVLICDNDNVSQFGEKSGIAGKCRYMAPSVVVGRKAPDKRTDQFSLAVVLFLLFLRNHPLEGETTQSKAVMTEQRQKMYYGESPVFIADPSDSSNRPVRGIHNNFILRWPQMPGYIQEAFIKSFSKGTMCEDKMGVTENEWLQNLLRFKAEVCVCPNCNNETRYYKANMSCVCCKAPIADNGWLVTSNYRIPLLSKKEIVKAYITDEYDHGEASELIAVIGRNKDKTKTSMLICSSEPMVINGETYPAEKRYVFAEEKELKIFKETVKIIERE